MRLRGALPAVICACGFSPNAGTQTDAPRGPIDSPMSIDSPRSDAPGDGPMAIDSPLPIDAAPDAAWLVPDKPTVMVGSGDRQITVSWMDGSDGHPLPVTHVAFAMTADGSAVGSGSCGSDTAPYSCTITGLTDGATYAVTVTVTGSAGSATSDPVDAMPIPAVLANKTNLVLWLDASAAGTLTASGGAVSSWMDQSGNANNAIQATAANQPMYSASDVGSAATVTFDGTNDELAVGSLIAASTSYTVIAVAADRETTPTANHWPGIYSTRKCGNGNAGFAFNGYANASMPVLDPTRRDVAGLSASSLRLDGAADTAGTIAVAANTWFVGVHEVTTNATSFGSTSLYIGGYSDAGCSGNISVGELLVFDTALGAGDNGSDVERLEEYATHKWQIPSPP